MTEAVEFQVEDAGQPVLQGSAEESVPEELATAPPAGWTQNEAAQVVGGMVANVALAMYVMRWKAPPAPELWPALAGEPTREFPLLGSGLAPVLDFLTPKGSAGAVGVSLTAGLGEVIGAMARRWEVVNTAPHPKGRPAAAPAPPSPAPGAPPPSEAGGFRFRSGELHVLAQADQSFVGMGIE